MINIRRKVPVLATLALALSLSLPAFGAEAENFVKGKHVELTELVSKAKSADDQKKLDAAFDAVFDYDGLAKATLKDSWEQRTPGERAEFTTLLKDLVRNAYRRNIKNTLGYEVDYKGEQDARRRQGRAHRRAQQEERPRRAGQHRLRRPPGRRQMADRRHRDRRLEPGPQLPKPVSQGDREEGLRRVIEAHEGQARQGWRASAERRRALGSSVAISTPGALFPA